MSNIIFSDGLSNLDVAIGQRLEKSDFTFSVGITNNTALLENLWRHHWIIQKICTKKANDLVRKWRKIQSNALSAQEIAKVEEVERKLNVKNVLTKALGLANLYGGVGIFILTDTPPHLALNPKEVIKKLLIIKPHELQAVGNMNTDVFSDNFQQWDRYKINNSVEVHASRLLLLNSIIPVGQEGRLFGLSAIEPIYPVLKRYEALVGNIGDLITESKVDIFKLHNLTNDLANGREQDIASAFSRIQQIKSSTNALLIDKENDYEQKELSFSGLRDLLVEFRSELAGAANMPLTILFGQSASGFSSGQEDIQNYHEELHAQQEALIRPVLERLDPLIFNMAVGEIPTDYWFDFLPLKDINELEKINALNAFASASNMLLQSGVLTEAQVASELKETGLFSKISDENIEELEALANE